MEIVDIQTTNLAYKLIGDPTNPGIVIETALSASSAEWWHLAKRWGRKYRILLYDRAGYGQSSPSSLRRTPGNVASELNQLVQYCKMQDFIIIGHSMGGLFAQNYARLYPNKVKGIILVDPVSPNNFMLRNLLSEEEFAKSGIDKSRNLKAGLIACTLYIGKLFIPILRKGPPFFYYNEFNKEAEKYILNNFTSKYMYQAAIEEYSYLEDKTLMERLSNTESFPKIPLHLICHTPEVMIKEIEYYGGADRRTAEKIDNIWVSLMKEYLLYSNSSFFQSAHNSGHYIHLSEPDIIESTLESLNL